MTHADTRSCTDHGTDGLSDLDVLWRKVSCYKQRDTRNRFAARGGLHLYSPSSRTERFLASL